MNDLLTALVHNPHDLDIRLAYAGAVEDGKCKLPTVDLRGGEVVHDQYGVPLRVKATMATWCGEECNNCNGSGEVYVGPGDIITPMDCRRCKGTGSRIPGIAAAVCGAWPITGVELTDIANYIDSDFAGDHWFCNECPREIWTAKVYGTLALITAAASMKALTFGRRSAGLPDLQFINHK